MQIWKSIEPISVSYLVNTSQKMWTQKIAERKSLQNRKSVDRAYDATMIITRK